MPHYGIIIVEADGAQKHQVRRKRVVIAPLKKLRGLTHLTGLFSFLKNFCDKKIFL